MGQSPKNKEDEIKLNYESFRIFLTNYFSIYIVLSLVQNHIFTINESSVFFFCNFFCTRYSYCTYIHLLRLFRFDLKTHDFS